MSTWLSLRQPKLIILCSNAYFSSCVTCLEWSSHHALDFPSYNLGHNLNSPSNPIRSISEMALKPSPTPLNVPPQIALGQAFVTSH